MARWKLCASPTFQILPLSTCTLASKNPISRKLFNRFSKSLPQLEGLRVCIWVKSFRCAGILLLQWQCENFVLRQHLKVCHFQHVHCASKNPISPKVFNRFSTSLPQLEDFKCGHLGVKFQVRRYFTFAMARWKLCQSTTFESLPLSTCTLCQQKSYISKGIRPIFEIFPSARRFWGWAFGWKASGAQVFYFLNGKVRTLSVDNIWKFGTFNLYTVPAKILYLQRYSTDFRNRCLSWTILRVGTWVERFRRADILLLQWQGENFAHQKHLKVCHFQLVHCARKNPISPKIFNRFWTSLPHIEDFERGHMGLKVSGAQVFYFCNGKVKTLPIDNIWKFATFNLYTVPEKILYLQRYSTDFRNLCLTSKILSVGIWVKSLRRAGILFFQWQGENIAHQQHLKVCHFQPVHCDGKNPISPKVFNRFSKSLPQLEDVGGGHWGGKLQVRRYFTFSMERWELCASTIFEILPLSTCTLCQENSHISKGIGPILEIFASVRRFWRWAFRWKISGAEVFYFWNGKVKTLRIANISNFATFNLYTGQQKSCISKVVQPIFEILASARRCWGWTLGWKVSGAQVFYFCNGKVKTLPIDNIWKFATFNLYTVPDRILYLQRYSTDFRNLRQKSYISKGIQPIFEIIASPGWFWGWAFAWKVLGAQVFYFCNGKVKTLPIDHIWKFATFNLYTVHEKIRYLQMY